jgi:hypothetical protein
MPFVPPSNPSCAKCQKTVYAVDKFDCLDKARAPTRLPGGEGQRGGWVGVCAESDGGTSDGAEKGGFSWRSESCERDRES